MSISTLHKGDDDDDDDDNNNSVIEIIYKCAFVGSSFNTSILKT